MTTILICVAASIFAAAVASAAPRGVLTKAEYQQLLAAEQRVKALSSKDAEGLKKADAICARIQKVSQLVSAVRSDCLDLVAFGSEAVKAENAATHCALDPPSEQAILRCLLPTFRTYYADARVFYLAEQQVAKIAAARGFSSRCVAVIGDMPKTITAEARLVTDLKEMVNALRTGNVNELQTVSNRIDKDSNAINPRSSSLSLCPHQ
ncbi:MAG TPA: hypothetical protein VHV75_17660 [Solirubrobacteraceae bacterium]|nr:hypothetical protein [Solirubrobacteraceae bacterium]